MLIAYSCIFVFGTISPTMCLYVLLLFCFFLWFSVEKSNLSYQNWKCVFEWQNVNICWPEWLICKLKNRRLQHYESSFYFEFQIIQAAWIKDGNIHFRYLWEVSFRVSCIDSERKKSSLRWLLFLPNEMRLGWRLLGGKMKYFIKKNSLFNFMWNNNFISNYKIWGISWPEKRRTKYGKILGN